MEEKKNIKLESGKLDSQKEVGEKIESFNRWYSSFDPNEEVEVNSDESSEMVRDRMRLKLLNEIKNYQKPGLQFVRFANTYWKAAASIAFFIILSSTFFYSTNFWKVNKPELVWNVKTTAAGEKKEIVLTDGSKIMLNAESKIKFPEKFTEGKPREIYLEGEAFFDVIHKNDQAFLVHAGNTITKDLGTKFNVKAFENEDKIIVSLVEGKVEVSLPQNKKNSYHEKEYLTPSKQFVFSKTNSASTIQDFDVEETVGWMNNFLVFHNEPIEQVAITLERNFGVRFEFMNSHISHKELTANFRNESLLTVVEVIRKVTGLNYKKVDENNRTVKIIFF